MVKAPRGPPAAVSGEGAAASSGEPELAEQGAAPPKAEELRDGEEVNSSLADALVCSLLTFSAVGGRQPRHWRRRRGAADGGGRGARHASDDEGSQAGLDTQARAGGAQAQAAARRRQAAAAARGLTSAYPGQGHW